MLYCDECAELVASALGLRARDMTTVFKVDGVCEYGCENSLNKLVVPCNGVASKHASIYQREFGANWFASGNPASRFDNR
jgi:hypothetical protein